MGWKIYRIWSTDWIKDPISEGEKLIAAVENAISSYDEIKVKEEPTYSEEDFVKVEDKSDSESNPIKVYGFLKIRKYDYFTEAPRNAIGYLPVHNCIPVIVKYEYPIHFELLCQRLLPLYNREKVTNVVREDVKQQIRLCNTEVKQIGDYIYPVEYSEIPIRLPNERIIKYISKEELSTAMLAILKTLIGPSRESLIDETSRVYDFKRTGPNIKSAMNEAVDFLIKTKKVEEVEEKLRIIP